MSTSSLPLSEYSSARSNLEISVELSKTAQRQAACDVNGVKSLVDGGHSIKWSTLAPRFGEFTVDSAKWYHELLLEPFHSCCSVPLAILVILYLLVYALFILFAAALLYLVGLVEEDSIAPDASWRSCVQCAWQSITTVGYGGISPQGSWSNVVRMVTVVLALVIDALGIGIIFQRLSMASHKVRTILHSERACVCHAQPGMPVRFECRVHHLADYALCDSSCKLVMARFLKDSQGTQA